MENQKDKKRIKQYFRRTAKNKIFAIALIIIGLLSSKIDNDSTFLVLTIIVGLPLFFARYNWMDMYE